jgi:hypothetical protein
MPSPYSNENPPPSVRIFIFLSYFHLLLMNFIYQQPQGLYPKACMDVEVSSNEDAELGPKSDAPVEKKASAGDDAGDGGLSSAEPNVPNPISSAAIQVPIIVPPTSGRGRKRPTPATRRNKPLRQADQVITHIELPPYCGPHSPLDLVNIEIIFGRIFEAFRHISQVVAASAVASDDDMPQKKLRRPPLRKVLAPR